MVVVDEAEAGATSVAEAAAAVQASAFRQDASAAGFHAFPVEARASQAGLVCREPDRPSFRDKTGESIALLLRAWPAIVA